jgi:predicted nucleic-acid-binding protein
MRAIDTNVLVRLLVRDDLDQTASAEAFIRGGAWASILALAEATWVLVKVYEFGAKDLATSIEMLLDHHDVVLQDPEAVTDALELFRSKPALGFSDCLMLHLARRAGHVPLGTFDRNLGRAAGAQKL